MSNTLKFSVVLLPSCVSISAIVDVFIGVLFTVMFCVASAFWYVLSFVYIAVILTFPAGFITSSVVFKHPSVRLYFIVLPSLSFSVFPLILSIICPSLTGSTPSNTVIFISTGSFVYTSVGFTSIVTIAVFSVMCSVVFVFIVSY